MATPTTIDTDTELSAVNSILGAIGQSPVTTLGTITETIGEKKYTGDNSTTTFAIVSSFTQDSEIKCSLDGTVTTAFSISGTNVVFTTAPGTGVVIRIYREKEIANTLANPEVSFIYDLLTEVNKDVQNEGWVWNIERHVKVTPDGDKHIEIPSNYLRYDVHNGLYDKTLDVVRRKKNVSGTDKYLLYDLVNHTYEFTGDKYLDIVYLYPYEELPNVFKRYITYRAAVRAATQLVANAQLVQLLQTQENMTRAACMEYECNQGSNSFFGAPHDSYYKSYQPYMALRR